MTYDRHLRDEELLDVVYDELRAMAGQQLGREQNANSLQPTVLANDAYLRLHGDFDLGDISRSHFFALAAKVMRRILVDHARTKRAQKRGGGVAQVTLTPSAAIGADASIDILALHEALESFSLGYERAAKVVELRFFGGLTEKEAAIELGISERTARSDWKFARAWLRSILGEEGE